MAFFSQQASELHFRGDPLPMAPTCSEQFSVNQMQQGLMKEPTCTLEQPQYEAPTSIVWKNAATGHQSILFNAPQGLPPVSVTAPQSVEPGDIQVLHGSEQFYANRIQQGLFEVPTCTLEQPQYEAGSNIVWDNAATGPQPPLSAMEHQNVQNLSESAARDVVPWHFQAVPDTQPPASTWSQTVREKRFLCSLCDYIGSSEEHWHAHAEAHRMSACNVRAKQVKRESLAPQRKNAAQSRPRTPKMFQCTYCPKSYVREVYYLSHMEKHLKAIQESGLNARSPGWDPVAVVSAAPMPAPVVFDPVPCPSSTVSMASPIAASDAASALTGSLPAMKFPPAAESQFSLDDLDLSEALVFPSEVEEENFEKLWEAMMYDIMVTNFGDFGDCYGG